MIRFGLSVNMLAVIVLACLATAVAAESVQDATRDLEFVTAEPRVLEVPRRARSAKVVAIFETRPMLTDWVRSEALASGAVARAFGWQDPEHPRRWHLPGPGPCWIESKKVYVDDPDRAADFWTVYAVDEASARKLVHALLRRYAERVAEQLEYRRADLRPAQQRARELEQDIARLESAVQEAKKAWQASGVERLSVEMIDSAIARFDQELRLNEVDTAGIDARLAAVKERTREGARDAEIPVREALNRIQVELEIELVGKLARKDALAREIARLERGRDCRTNLTELERSFANKRHDLKNAATSVGTFQEWVDGLERLADFTVVDKRVVISPIAPTK